MNKTQIKESMAQGGHVARYTLLAHAFARGVPYHVLELTTRQDHKPNPLAVQRLLDPTATRAQLEQAVAPVVEWMQQEPPVGVVEHNRRVREEYMQAKAQRRQRYEALRRNSG